MVVVQRDGVHRGILDSVSLLAKYGLLFPNCDIRFHYRTWNTILYFCPALNQAELCVLQQDCEKCCHCSHFIVYIILNLHEQYWKNKKTQIISRFYFY